MKNDQLVIRLTKSANQKLDNTIHFILQAKGGIGKSYVATMIAQYCQLLGLDLKAFDLDQENTTFAGFGLLNVTHINVYDRDRNVDPKGFDGLMEILLTQDGTYVIDTGANTFSSLLSYLVSNNVFELMEQYGKRVFVHTIVGGGAELEHTASGFNSIAKYSSAPIILWLNEHFGQLEIETNESDEHGKKITKSFADTKVFKANEDRLAGVIQLRSRDAKSTGEDIKKMNTLKLTVNEALANPKFCLMEKQRLQQVGKDIFGQLAKINFD